MSDHSNLNLHRGDGVSRRGVGIALLVVFGILAIIAIAGSLGSGGDGTAPAGGDAIAPAAETPALPTE